MVYSIRRNVTFIVNTFIKLGLYKSPILPILLYELDCLTLAKTDLQNLFYFKKKILKAVEWRTGQFEDCKSQLRLLNILSLSMYLQLKNLTLSKLVKENSEHIDLPEINEQRGRETELFSLFVETAE